MNLQPGIYKPFGFPRPYYSVNLLKVFYYCQYLSRTVILITLIRISIFEQHLVSWSKVMQHLYLGLCRFSA